MSNSHFGNGEYMDRVTMSEICREVGERLCQQLEPDNSQLPHHLQTLMEELRWQDEG